jgi:tetratricopeptide (TPR) repeat protein
MKVVHHKKGEEEMLADLRHAAKHHEEEGELEQAATTYEKILRKAKTDTNAFDRLMILYRKQKLYDKELKTINKALALFTKLHSPKATGEKVTALSRKLMRLTCLSDKKGNSLYEAEPLGRWRRRKLWVEKRVGSR